MKKVTHNRNKWLHLRLTAVEHRILISKYNETTCRSLSEFIRDRVFDRPLVAMHRNASQDDMILRMSTLNKELNAIGNNFNQITKRLHMIQPGEAQLWASQSIRQGEMILLKIDEVKAILRTISERWLR